MAALTLACKSMRADDKCLRSWRCTSADSSALRGLCSRPRSLLPGCALHGGTAVACADCVASMQSCLSQHWVCAQVQPA